MNNNQNPALRKKIMGSVTFNDDKLRVNYASGTESVLFEDIASISYRRRESPNNLYIILGTFIGTALIFYGIFEASQFLPLTGVIVMILGGVLGFIDKIYWDDVDIETTGGKIIYYSVDKGKGEKQMNEIEEAKRERIGK